MDAFSRRYLYNFRWLQARFFLLEHPREARPRSTTGFVTG